MSRRSRPRSRGWPTPPSTAGGMGVRRAMRRAAARGDPVAAVERPRAEAAGQRIERDRDDHLRTVTTVAGKSCRGQREPADLDQRVGAALPRRAVVGHAAKKKKKKTASGGRRAAARDVRAVKKKSDVPQSRSGRNARAAQGVERRPGTTAADSASRRPESRTVRGTVGCERGDSGRARPDFPPAAANDGRPLRRRRERRAGGRSAGPACRAGARAIHVRGRPAPPPP